MTSLSPEIEAAIAALRAGKPLGEVIKTLSQINKAAVLETYASGMSLRECGMKHGIHHTLVAQIIKEQAPHLMRPFGPAGWKKNREARAS